MFGDLRRQLALERVRREGFEDALTGAPLPMGDAKGGTAEEREAYRYAYQRGEQAKRRLCDEVAQRMADSQARQ